MDDRARAPAVAVDQVEAADCEARSPSSPPGEARRVARLGGKGGEQQQQQQLHERTEGPAAACEAKPADFEEIIAPLEKASGKPLGGPGRELCRTAFDENAHGFGVCAAAALARATSNALGLLVRMVRDGDHRDVQPPSASSSPSFQRAEQWTRNAGCQLEPADFVDELANRFPGLDDLACHRLSRLYDELQPGAADEPRRSEAVDFELPSLEERRRIAAEACAAFALATRKVTS